MIKLQSKFASMCSCEREKIAVQCLDNESLFLQEICLVIAVIIMLLIGCSFWPKGYYRYTAYAEKPPGEVPSAATQDGAHHDVYCEWMNFRNGSKFFVPSNINNSEVSSFPFFFIRLPMTMLIVVGSPNGRRHAYLGLTISEKFVNCTKKFVNLLEYHWNVDIFSCNNNWSDRRTFVRSEKIIRRGHCDFFSPYKQKRKISSFVSSCDRLRGTLMNVGT